VEFLPEGHPDCGYGNFTDAIEFIKNLEGVTFIKGYVYFFEMMKKHTINYDWDNVPKAVLFDIYNVVEDEYIHRANFDTFVTPELIVPCIFEGEYKDFDGKIPKSVYYDGKAEGYVIKPAYSVMKRDIHGNIHRAKVVGDNFKEAKKGVWGAKDEPNAAFVNKYCTTARIDKQLHKLADNGHEIKPQMIGTIVYNTMKDICDEEFKKLAKIGKVDFNIIKKEVQIRVKNNPIVKVVL
jgi:hypothetical protein